MERPTKAMTGLMAPETMELDKAAVEALITRWANRLEPGGEALWRATRRPLMTLGGLLGVML